mmetsp:Transcript_28518/g.59542  ORF Transcript_28518/g.59542 Transcript_28518/m.59542 type:complete len:91 (+) Transcript_28518:2609-2881(+)
MTTEMKEERVKYVHLGIKNYCCPFVAMNKTENRTDNSLHALAGNPADRYMCMKMYKEYADVCNPNKVSQLVGESSDGERKISYASFVSSS